MVAARLMTKQLTQHNTMHCMYDMIPHCGSFSGIPRRLRSLGVAILLTTRESDPYFRARISPKMVINCRKQKH